MEVLVALVLTALAAGALAAVAATSGRVLTAARRDATGTALASARAEALRGGPRTAGADSVTRGGETYVDAWSTAPGRGRPDALDVTVTWPGHEVTIATEAWR